MTKVGSLCAMFSAILVSAGMLASCGGERSPEAHASDQALVEATASGSAEAESELERRGESLGDVQRKLEALRKKGFEVDLGPDPRLRRLQELQRREDQATDQEFAKTPVDKALDLLPQKKPPLNVIQWVETDLGNDLIDASKSERERFYGMTASERKKFLAPKVSHEVYARVDRDRWYRMTEAQRARAVKSFYRAAQKAFEKNGIDDLVLVVAPLNETTEHLPALAIGRNGAASLTALGRERRAPQL